MKTLLLGSTTLVALSLVAGTANAACTTTTPTTGQTVDCTGTSTTPVVGGNFDTNITVNIDNGAQLNVATDKAVRLRGGSHINLLGSGQINTTGNFNYGAAIADGNGTITLNGTSHVTTAGNFAAGVNANGVNNNITLNGDSQITTTGTDAHDIVLYGSGGVTLNDQVRITASGLVANGINLFFQDSLVTLNNSAYIGVSGPQGIGIQMIGGSRNIIQLNGTSTIHTTGATGFGIYDRDTATSQQHIILNDGASIRTYGANADGIKLNSTQDTVTLNGAALIRTNNTGAHGIELSGNNSGVYLTGNSLISTLQNGAHGILVNSNNNLVSATGGDIVTAGAAADAVRVLGSQNTIRLGTDSVVNVSGAGSFGINLAGSDNTAVMSGNSILRASGANGDGIHVAGPNNTVIMNDTSLIQMSGAGTLSGINLTGANDRVVMNGNARIGTNFGGGQARGITMAGGQGEVTLNDQAVIRSINPGIAVTSDNNTVNLRGHSLLDNNSSGILVQGNDNSINLFDDANIATLTAVGIGVDVAGNGNAVVLNDRSVVTGTGAGTFGIRLTGNDNALVVLDGATVSSDSNFAVVLSGSNTVANLGTIAGSAAILGDNNAANSDTILNFGRLVGTGATLVELKAGDDTLALGSGTVLDGGELDGGAGSDLLALFGSGSASNDFTNFETLTVDHFFSPDAPDWSLSGTSTFGTKIDIVNGRLAINGNITTPATTVRDGGILGGNGTLVSNVTSTGHIAPGNSVGTLTINGNFTQTGGAFDVEAGSGGVDRLNVLGAAGATLAGGPTLNVIPTGGSTGGAGIILHANNGITGTFGSVNFQGNGAATITQTANDISLIAVDGTPAISGDFAAAEAGLDFLDSIGAEQIAGLAHCGYDQCARLDDSQKHVWMKAFGHFGNEAAGGGDRAFDYTIAGTAMGGDMHVTKDLSVGVSAGYSNTDETVSQHAATADINTGQLGLYANWQHGPFFVTGLLSGGWQSLDLSRNVGAGEADASTTGWLFGSSLQAGAQFSFPKGWRLTPSAGIAYQHQWIEAYSEHGAGAADVSIKGHQADALRLKAQLELANDIELTGYTLTPHLTIGVQQQENLGGHATGAFSTGDGFTLNLKDDSRTIGLIGLGMEVGFQNGLSTYVNYDGALASGRTVQAVTGGLRYSW